MQTAGHCFLVQAYTHLGTPQCYGSQHQLGKVRQSHSVQGKNKYKFDCIRSTSASRPPRGRGRACLVCVQTQTVVGGQVGLANKCPNPSKDKTSESEDTQIKCIKSDRTHSGIKRQCHTAA